MKHNTSLDHDRIVRTISLLEKRISDRFPNSGLRKVIIDLLHISKKSKEHVAWISKPNIPLRILSAIIISLGVGGLIYS